MSGIHVKKSGDDFIVTKGTQSFTVKDKNKNGRIDQQDIWVNAAGKVSKDEMWEAMGLSLAKENMTTEEMAEYEKFKEQRDAKDKYKQQIAEQKEQAEKPKKGGFWNKMLNVCQTAMPFMVIGSLGMGILSSFSLNKGNAADSAIKWSAIANLGMMGMNSAVAMSAIKNANQTGVLNNAGGMSNPYAMLGPALTAQNTWMKEQDELWNSGINDIKEDNDKKAKEAANKKNRDAIDKLAEDADDEDSVYDSSNKDYLKSLQDFDGTREYTDEEINNVKQIQATPRIPLKHIDSESKDESKLTKESAEKLNKLLKKYEDANGDNKLKVMSEENYNKMKEILGKETLTKADIEQLEDIYKNRNARK